MNVDIRNTLGYFPKKNLEAVKCFLNELSESDPIWTWKGERDPGVPLAIYPYEPENDQLINDCCYLFRFAFYNSLPKKRSQEQINKLWEIILNCFDGLEQKEIDHFFVYILKPLRDHPQLGDQLITVHNYVIQYFLKDTALPRHTLLISRLRINALRRFLPDFLYLAMHTEQLLMKSNRFSTNFLRAHNIRKINQLTRTKLIDLISQIFHLISTENDPLAEGTCTDNFFQYSFEKKPAQFNGSTRDENAYIEQFLILPLIRSTYRMQTALIALLLIIENYYPHGFPDGHLFSKIPYMDFNECREKYDTLVKLYPAVHNSHKLLHVLSNIVAGQIIHAKITKFGLRERQRIGRAILLNGLIFQPANKFYLKAEKMDYRRFRQFVPTREFEWPYRPKTSPESILRSIQVTLNAFELNSEITAEKLYKKLKSRNIL